MKAEKSCQAVNFANVSRVRFFRKISMKLSAWRIFKCVFLTLHPYYIYPHYPQKYERPFREKNLERFSITHTPVFQKERELLILSEKSFQPKLIPSPLVIPLEEICTQTQPTHFQNVESVLELRKLWGFVKRSR